MPDLFTWLTARYVEEHGTGASPGASDAALQWMELQLQSANEGSADERYLLEQYLALNNDELQAIPAAVHGWFLERWSLAGPGTDDAEKIEQLAGRIAEMYLIAGPGIHQASVVAALLAFDRSWQQRPSHATRIWDLITEHVADDSQAAALAPLIESLLDFVYLTPQNEVALRALGDIARLDAGRRYAVPLMRERVALIGETHDGPVARLLSDFDR